MDGEPLNRRSAFRLAICLGVFLLQVLFGCTAGFQSSKAVDVPVDVFRPGTRDIDMDVIMKAVAQEIQAVLPGAYFQGMVFSGRCSDLPQLRGKLILVFVRVQAAITTQRVVRATATVDTVRQAMNLHYVDESAFYPSTQPQTFLGDCSIKKTAGLAHRHITDLGLSDCDVTLTQSGHSWDVRCGPLSDFTQRCWFEIVEGEIRDRAK